MHKYHKIIIKITHFLQKYPREYYVFAFFSLFLFAIIFKLFSFTVINSVYYKDLAIKQQTSKTLVQVSRWNIYSSNEKWKVLATSVDLNDLAIDPSIEWNKTKLIQFLTDIIYNEICYLKSANQCKKSLQKFIWVLDIEDFRLNEIYLKEKINSKLKELSSRTKVTSVLLKDDLTIEQSFELEKMKLGWVYVNWTNLYVNPEEIVDDSFIATKLSVVIKKDVEDIKYLIRKRVLKYLLILPKISITTSETIKQKLDEEKQAYSRWFIWKQDLIGPFIILSPSWHRYYPENDMASTVLWFVDNAWEWKYWIEWYFNDLLKWKTSNKYAKKDIMGRLIEPMNLDDQTNLAWANITLTIDRNIQKAVEEIIDNDLATYRANSISVIIMDPKTWAVLAMATNPRFDPNNPWEAYELERVTYSKYPNPDTDLLWARVLAVDNSKWTEYIYNWKKIYLREISREELWDNRLEKYVFVNKKWWGVYKNDIIQDLYEPGSIFKPIVFAAAIDSWEISRYDMYKDNWFVQIDNFKIKNVSSKCMWYKTFQNAMNYSCNVWMINIAQKIWASIFYKYIDSFWIGKKTWITLEWEVSWKLDPYEKWWKAQLFTTSFGQWITVTMLQMASVYSVIANWGVYYKPRIVKSIEFADWKKIINKPEATHRVLKESTAKTMIQVLVDWVNNWVAKNWAVKWYSIAWKTWTAQIAYKWKYESWVASTMWFFAWIAPAEDPKFVMIVKVERPRSSIYGWETVARTFSRISQYLFNYYWIPPKSVK